jgi:NTE family protein
VAETVGLVLAGGGARGAYEIGVLRALLPRLERDGQRPRLIVGTSIGALNAAYLAATVDEDPCPALERAWSEWARIRFRMVVSPFSVLPWLGYIGEVARLPVQATRILDTRPMSATIERIVPFDRLHDNTSAGLVRLAVATTSALSSQSVIFHEGGSTPERDRKRGIAYVPTELGTEHVRASAAVPALFPAVHLTTPGACGWYFDGGTRLNTPIKPAVALDADRIVVIGLNSVAPPEDPLASNRRPDLLQGGAQLAQGLLVDTLANDIHDLVTGNRMVCAAKKAGVKLPQRRELPYIFVAPQEPEAIGRVAHSVFKSSYSSLRRLLRLDDIALLGRLTVARRGAIHGELLSYLFFAPEFTSKLLEMGRRDAEAWMNSRHDDGLWRICSAPPGTGA